MIWGPVTLAVFIFIFVAVGYGLSWIVAHWGWKQHRLHQEQTKRIMEIIAETRRLLAKDPTRVGQFIDAFGRDLLDHFGAEPTIRGLTIHDLRNHVEIAVFNLLAGCPCGNCPGVSQGPRFWIEAQHDWSGLLLQGFVSKGYDQVALRVDVRRPNVKSATHENVTMVCVVCKEMPVVTSIEHIGEGKPPTCAGCLSKAKKVPGA